ncbi:MAG: metallophosphoesterase [Christensenellaceae bacterium]|nr:metallophosphoesterase [Christensenellaceae bacterium]MEA5068099.1 metallophosphoesterase [Christensenellaceae bacterium]
MIRLGLVSDSHGAAMNIARAAEALRGVDALIHLGDVSADAGRFEALLRVPVHAVRGNCDVYSATAPEEMTLTVEGIRLLLTHGHRLRVKQGLLALACRARETGAQAALYGHTHVPSVERAGDILLLNPGALLSGRYAVLEFREGGPTPVMKIL